MKNYIDGFVFPLPKIHLNEYKVAAEQVAAIWKEYGALAYFEYLGNDMHLEGTRSFAELVDLKEDEVVIFGWVVFPSKEIRDQTNQAVPQDPRMSELVAPLVDPKRMIFNAERMVYGGFEGLIST